jgi:hypothetical protein
MKTNYYTAIDPLEKQREYMRHFIREKKKLGWRNMSVIVPLEVYESLKQFKKLKMAEYRLNRLRGIIV